MKSQLVTIAAALMLTSCAPSIRLQPAEPAKIGALQVVPQETWNILPAAMTPFSRKDAQVWTRDGVLLDRLLIIPTVPAGEPLFREANKAVALPRFKADMLPDELAQLTESSIVKLLGEGDTVVTTKNLRPTRFGDRRGVMFELTATRSEGPKYRGLAGAFIADEQLNMVLFIAADPYYFDKTREAAERVISSARL